MERKLKPAIDAGGGHGSVFLRNQTNLHRTTNMVYKNQTNHAAILLEKEN